MRTDGTRLTKTLALAVAGEDEDDMVDGWDLVQRPLGWGGGGGGTAGNRRSPNASLVGTFSCLGAASVWAGMRDGDALPLLPPTPSQADDVAHWERAMFTDATTRTAVAAAGARGPMSPAALERTLLAAANVLSSPLMTPFRRASQP